MFETSYTLHIEISKLFKCKYIMHLWTEVW